MNAQHSLVKDRTSLGAWLATCALSALPLAGHAESLTDAWVMAMQSDGNLAAAHSEREAAEADQSAALRQRLPALDLNGTYTQLDQSPIIDIATPTGQFQSPKIWKHDAYTMGGANASLPVWTSGRLSGAIGAAAAGARGASAQEMRGGAELKLAVAESYVTVFRARRALQVAESSVASLTAHAHDVQSMYEKEAVTQSDLLAAQVALANATQQRLHAANAQHLAIAAYNRWVGQPLDRIPDLEEPAAGPSVAAGEPLDQLIAHALENRPELAATTALQDKLEQSARSERAASLPQVALQAGYNHFDNAILNRENFASVGVAFQWRLFDSGQIRERTAALRSRARAAKQQLANQKSVVALEVETAVLNREEAAARIHAAAAAVIQAQDNLRIAEELYRSGLGTNTQVLDAETLRVSALTNRDDAQFDLLLSGYRIQKAIGDL